MHEMHGDPNHFIGLVFLFVAFPIWIAAMAHMAYFFLHIAPCALRRWAEEEGFQVIQRKEPTIRDRLSLVWERGFKRLSGPVYRVLVRDKSGWTREGLVLVGSHNSYAFSVSRCPVEVRWTGPAKATSAIGPSSPESLMWDREIDL
jgi:hypothetical protein